MKKGVSLIWVVILTTIIMAIVSALTSATIKEIQMASGADLSIKAYAAAKAGVEVAQGNCDPAIYPDTTPPTTYVTDTASTASYSIQNLSKDSTSGECEFDSVGSVGNVSRKIHADITQKNGLGTVINFPDNLSATPITIQNAYLNGGGIDSHIQLLTDTAGPSGSSVIQGGNQGGDFTQQFDASRTGPLVGIAPIGTGSYSTVGPYAGSNNMTSLFSVGILPNDDNHFIIYYGNTPINTPMTYYSQAVNFPASISAVKNFRFIIQYKSAAQIFYVKIIDLDTQSCVGSTNFKMPGGAYSFSKIAVGDGFDDSGTCYPVDINAKSWYYYFCDNTGPTREGYTGVGAITSLYNPYYGLAVNYRSGIQDHTQTAFLKNMAFAGVGSSSWIRPKAGTGIEFQVASIGINGTTNSDGTTTDAPYTKPWSTSVTGSIICPSPNCQADPDTGRNNLVSPKQFPGVDFSNFPAQTACKNIGGKLPTLEELLAIYANNDYYKLNKTYSDGSDYVYLSSSEQSATNAWGVDFNTGSWETVPKSTGWRAVRCLLDDPSNFVDYTTSPPPRTIYVANQSSNNVLAYDSITGSLVNTIPSANAYGVAYNNTTGMLFVTDNVNNKVYVYKDPDYSLVATISVGVKPSGIAINESTNTVYVANYVGISSPATVSAIHCQTSDCSTSTVATINTGMTATRVAVDPLRNKVYVAEYGNSRIGVIDGTTDTVTATIAVSGAWDIDIDLVNNIVYASSQSGTVAVINGATNTLIATKAVRAGAITNGIAYDYTNAAVYVGEDSGIVEEYSASTFTLLNTINVGGGQAYYLDADPLNNKIYGVQNGDNLMVTIDGATNTASSMAVGSYPRTLFIR